MVRLNSILHYFFGLPDKELQIVERQKQLRNALHRQINLSNIKLNSTTTIIKTGIYGLDKTNLSDSQILKLHSKIIIPNENFRKKRRRLITKKKTLKTI
tara:strand:+ start:843 stop:1139 length:297 start_codon:yes stop_codon:yes gene_type:complete